MARSSMLCMFLIDDVLYLCRQQSDCAGLPLAAGLHAVVRLPTIGTKHSSNDLGRRC